MLCDQWSRYILAQSFTFNPHHNISYYTPEQYTIKRFNIAAIRILICFLCPLNLHSTPGLALSIEIHWRFWWKKGATFFTQEQTLSKTLQISHAVLFRCVKQCSVCFFGWSLLRFQDITYAKMSVFVVSSARDCKDGNFTKILIFATCNLKKCWF